MNQKEIKRVEDHINQPITKELKPLVPTFPEMSAAMTDQDIARRARIFLGEHGVDEELVQTYVAFAASEVARAVAAHRKAIKLIIGRRSLMPWNAVPDADVDSWLKAAAEMKGGV